MQLLFENKIVSREQIGSRLFPNVCKDVVNRRLRKLVDLGLLRRKRAFEGRLAIVRCEILQKVQLEFIFKDVPFGTSLCIRKLLCWFRWELGSGKEALRSILLHHVSC